MQSCFKPFTEAFITALAVAFLLIFSIGQGLPAEGAVVSHQESKPFIVCP